MAQPAKTPEKAPDEKVERMKTNNCKKLVETSVCQKLFIKFLQWFNQHYSSHAFKVIHSSLNMLYVQHKSSKQSLFFFLKQREPLNLPKDALQGS